MYDELRLTEFEEIRKRISSKVISDVCDFLSLDAMRKLGKALGMEEITAEKRREYVRLRKIFHQAHFFNYLELMRLCAHTGPPTLEEVRSIVSRQVAAERNFARWVRSNGRAGRHRYCRILFEASELVQRNETAFYKILYSIRRLSSREASISRNEMLSFFVSNGNVHCTVYVSISRNLNLTRLMPHLAFRQVRKFDALVICKPDLQQCPLQPNERVNLQDLRRMLPQEKEVIILVSEDRTLEDPRCLTRFPECLRDSFGANYGTFLMNAPVALSILGQSGSEMEMDSRMLDILGHICRITYIPII